MNINGIFDILQPNPYTQTAAKANAASTSSFGDMLSAESANSSQMVESRGHIGFMNGKNIFEMDYEDSMGRTQSIRIQYAAESTEYDPVVRISCNSFSGSYTETVRIRSITLEHATYPELCALLAHENALKMKANGGVGIPVGTEDNAAHAAALANGQLTLDDLMRGVDMGDFSVKRNLLQEYADQYSLDYITIDIPITEDETQTVIYGDGMSPEQKAAQAEFDQLMKTIDTVIEMQKKQAEEAKKEAEKEELERLYDAKAFERDFLLKQADEKKILEELL